MAENNRGNLTEQILDQYQAKAGQKNALKDPKLASDFWGFANPLSSLPSMFVSDEEYGKQITGFLQGLIGKQGEMDAAATAAENKAIEGSSTDPAAQQRLSIPRKNIGRSSTILAGGANYGAASLNSSGSLTARRYLLGA